jgi:hypothetical protein
MSPLSRAVSLLLAMVAIAAGAAMGESFPDFATDGAWCWFSDPRAISRNGTIDAGWVKSDGSIEIGAWNRASGKVTTRVLHAAFERDDHDAPALIFLPDGRLAAFYSLHAKGDMRLRVTTRPEDISDWAPERELGFVQPERGKQGVTYANPALLACENNALYVFWRGSDFKPTFSVSKDLGVTWSAPRAFIARPGADNTNRPYLKACNNGVDRIDFVFTDGHPRDEPTNSVYYLRYEHGAFYKADGTRLGGMEALPIDPARCDRVYDGATAGRAWIWDIAVDPLGCPVIAFTRLPKETDHRYAFARWDGKRWRVSELCRAGRWFPRAPAGKKEPEPHYSGGMALDHADPYRLYLSRKQKDAFEIEQWASADKGVTWTSQTLTVGSRKDNVRPFVVRNASAGDPSVLWMSNERYIHYDNFRASIKMARPVIDPTGNPAANDY